MKITSVSNPVWADVGHTIIDCVVTFDNMPHPVPIGVMANADTDYLQKLWSECLNGVHGTIAPYVSPTPTNDQKKAQIVQQLNILDGYIPRGLEDMWAATNFDTTQLPQVQQNRLAQKQSLRIQYQQL